ncbi:alpha/beta fold hydrolase [uncultured Sphaerochaeta sp.]|uniref:alpha/beta hydrolase n=1 Tax=uncultured Sphaerochaeta sp. TaxID=886478 RepID=UPI0029CA2496|nr:alpha/beta fold hydrolase [uncultured Sphaerochaeta sp.]
MRRLLIAVVLGSMLLFFGCTKADTTMEEGYWEGIVSVEENRFFIHLRSTDTGLFLSIPELLATDVPVQDLKISEEQWSGKVTLGTTTLRLLLAPEENGFSGKVLYNTTNGTVLLREGRYSVEYRNLTKPARTGKTVSLETSKATLYGTLLTPEGEGPFPTVLIIAGSGPTDRDGNSELLVENNDSLWHLAHELLDAGIASLRYDKFAVGESQPYDEQLLEEITFEDFVADAVSWINYIQSGAKHAPVGIIGHSEGSLIALLAAQAEPVDFVVSVAGNGDPIGEQMIKQIRRMDSEAAKVLEKRLQEISVSQYEETGNLLVDSFIPLGKERYLQTWMKYNPTDVLRTLSVPTLVIWGDHDERLVGEDDLFGRTNMPDTVAFSEVSNMGHLLRWAEEDADIIRSYRDRDMPLHPDFLQTVTTFIKAQEGLRQ